MYTKITVCKYKRIDSNLHIFTKANLLQPLFNLKMLRFWKGSFQNLSIFELNELHPLSAHTIGFVHMRTFLLYQKRKLYINKSMKDLHQNHVCVDSYTYKRIDSFVYLFTKAAFLKALKFCLRHWKFASTNI